MQVDDTALMEVLREEPSFSGQLDPRAAAADGAEAAGPASGNALAAKGDLFELIKAGVKRDHESRGLSNIPGAVGLAVPMTEADKPQFYGCCIPS